MITETDECKKWLDDAALIWPELRGNRAELLRRLIEAGHEHLAGTAAAALEERRRKIREGAGTLSGIWPPNPRDELLADWDR